MVLYMVDGSLHTRKDLQLIKGQVLPTKEKSEKQVKEDKIGKTAYNPELRDLTQSKLSPEKVETMIAEPRKSRGKQIDFVKLSATTFRPRTKK